MPLSWSRALSVGVFTVCGALVGSLIGSMGDNSDRKGGLNGGRIWGAAMAALIGLYVTREEYHAKDAALIDTNAQPVDTLYSKPAMSEKTQYMVQEPVHQGMLQSGLGQQAQL